MKEVGTDARAGSAVANTTELVNLGHLTTDDPFSMYVYALVLGYVIVSAARMFYLRARF